MTVTDSSDSSGSSDSVVGVNAGQGVDAAGNRKQGAPQSGRILSAAPVGYRSPLRKTAASSSNVQGPSKRGKHTDQTRAQQQQQQHQQQQQQQYQRQQQQRVSLYTSPVFQQTRAMPSSSSSTVGGMGQVVPNTAAHVPATPSSAAPAQGDKLDRIWHLVCPPQNAPDLGYASTVVC